MKDETEGITHKIVDHRGTAIEVMQPATVQQAGPENWITQALEKNLPVETLEKLMDLADRWQAKQAKEDYLKAFSRFQGLLPKIKKTKKVGYDTKDGTGKVDYKYAPLDTICAAIQPALEQCGLSYRWQFEDLDGWIKGTCILSHTSSHSEQNTMKAKEDNSGKKNPIQAIASARTYIQRYTLIGVCGLSTAEEDTDGRGTGPDTKKDFIPAPPNAAKVAEIKKCNTRPDLDKLWKELSEADKATYQKTFNIVAALINDAAKKETKAK